MQINNQQQMINAIKTIDLNNAMDQQRIDDTLHHYKSNSASSKQSVGIISGNQNSLQKHQRQQSQQPGQFPMNPDDVIKIYGKYMSQYEREEIMDYDVVYYMNLNSKNKGIG